MGRALSSFAVVALLGCGSTDCGTGADDAAAPSREGDARDARFAAMTLNIANGAGDSFRTAESRTRQGGFIARMSVDVVAMQEVDIGVDRSGDVDTVAGVASAVASGFERCTFEIEGAPHVRRDGTRLARCAGGAIAFGIGFRADDRFAAASNGAPSGIMDGDTSLNPTGVDRGEDAFYGNALLVRAPWGIDASYTVALPISEAGPNLPSGVLDRLARGDLDDDVVADLAVHNEAVRRQQGIEPRSVLVARIRLGTAPSFSVLSTHLESGGTKALRDAQLGAVVAVARAEQLRSRNRVVVMGDFNMPASGATPGMVAAGFVHAAPPNAEADIDQIWVDGTLAVEAVARPPTEGVSDHAVAPTATLRPVIGDR